MQKDLELFSQTNKMAKPISEACGIYLLEE